MPRSQDRTQGKCFSGIVSRLLCTRSLPTHPTPPPENDQIAPKPKHRSFKYLISNQHVEDISSKPSNEQQDVAEETILPGVVARLMGLESMPPKDGNLGSYLRSRSVNFVDYFYSFDDLKPQHRRVKTSLSFREVPAHFEKGNALEKEKGDQHQHAPKRLLSKRSKVGSNSSNIGSDNKQLKQTKVNKNEEHGGNFLKKKHSRIPQEHQRKFDARSALKIEATRKRIGPERIKGGSRDDHLGLNNKLKHKKKRLANRRKHDECYPESTSSVSDTCPEDSSSHLKFHKSGGHQELTCLKKLKEFDERFDKEELSSVLRRDMMDMRTRLDSHSGRYLNMLDNVKKLAQNDITGSSWIVMEFQDLEEICVYLGDNILQLLLSRLMDEFIRL